MTQKGDISKIEIITFFSIRFLYAFAFCIRIFIAQKYSKYQTIAQQFSEAEGNEKDLKSKYVHFIQKYYIYISCLFFEIKRFSVWSFIRSSHQRCSIKKGVLRNFIKFTGKHLCQGLFFNKVEHRIYRTPSVAASSSLMNVKGDLTKVEISEHLIKIFRGNVYLCTIVYKLKMFIPNINYAFKIHCHSGESAIRLFTKSRIIDPLYSRTLTFQKNLSYLLESPFKKDEKCFLFHLKGSFRSQDI